MGVGGAGVHEARRQRLTRRSVAGSIEGGIVQHLARRRAPDRRRAGRRRLLRSGSHIAGPTARSPTSCRRTTRSSRRRSTAASAATLGAAQACAAACATATAQGRAVGPITYGSATPAPRTTRRTCRGMSTCRIPPGRATPAPPPSTTSATSRVSVDTIRDPSFSDLRDPRGHAERALPERHAAGAPDRRRTSSTQLSAAGATPGPNQYPGLYDHSLERIQPVRTA